MVSIIFRLFGLLVVTAGVIFIYDARLLTQVWFGWGDQNEATKGIKILGTMVFFIGALVIYFCR